MGSPVRRLFTILLGTLVLLGYSLYEKSLVEEYFSKSDAYVLKVLPKSKVSLLNVPDEQVSVTSYLEDSKTTGLYIHFWATWCGPCEKELPEFVKFAETLQSSGIKFLILAVKDNLKKVNKFVQKLNVSENVEFGLDNDGSVMKMFGTLRVPETYLFSKNSNLIKKFIGPQGWEEPYFYNNSRYLLNLN